MTEEYRIRMRGHPARPLLVLLISLLCLCAAAEGAEEVISGEADRKGTIRIVYEAESNAVAGAVFQIFRIGTVSQETVPSEEMHFAKPTGAKVRLHFKSLVPELDLSELEGGNEITSLRSAQKAAQKYEQVLIRQMQKNSGYDRAGYEGATDRDGRLVIRDVLPGVYLVREITPAKGYRSCVPFLVSVPAMEHEEWKYEVTAMLIRLWTVRRKRSSGKRLSGKK